MKTLPYYNAAVTDLQNAINHIEGVNQNFPQYRIAVRDLKKKLAALKEARDKRERNA